MHLRNKDRHPLITITPSNMVSCDRPIFKISIETTELAVIFAHTSCSNTAQSITFFSTFISPIQRSLKYFD